MKLISKIKHSKFYFFIKIMLGTALILSVMKLVFPHVEFVVSRLIDEKVGVVSGPDYQNKAQFYSDIMTFAGAMAAMLYLLYMMITDESKESLLYKELLAVSRRHVISSFLMILFAMLCFTAVHIMPNGNLSLLEVVAYSGLFMFLLSFWYIFFAAINLFYINWNAIMLLEEQSRSKKTSSKKLFSFFRK